MEKVNRCSIILATALGLRNYSDTHNYVQQTCQNRTKPLCINYRRDMVRYLLVGISKLIFQGRGVNDIGVIT